MGKITRPIKVLLLHFDMAQIIVFKEQCPGDKYCLNTPDYGR